MEYFTKKRVIYGTKGSEHKPIVVDDAGRLTEAVYVLETVSTTHFTGAIAQNEQETESLPGMVANKTYIRGVNIQTMENLHYRLILWSNSTFDDTDLDVDTYIDHVDLDIPTNGFRIWDGVAFHQYYLDVAGLGIIYEDDSDEEHMHISLQNLSVAPKTAGAAGAVQLDILYALRL